MARGWEKPPDCKQPELGRTIRDIRLKAGVKQKDLAQKLGVSQSALSHFEKGGDRCFTVPQRETLIDEATASLQRRGIADVATTRRRLLQLAFLTPVIRLGKSPEEELGTEWERKWQEAIEARAQGNHEQAQRLFRLVEHLGADIPGLPALAIAHQAQEALDLHEHPSVTGTLITTGLRRLGGISLPPPELSPSPNKLVSLLPDDISRRAYAQLAKASVRRFQDMQAFPKAWAALQSYESTGKIIEDHLESTRTLVECTHHQALLLSLAHIAPTRLDSLAWSWVRDASAFRRAADLFEKSYNARVDNEVGRAFDLRGMLKTLHMLETCSSLGAREKRQIAAQRQDIEQALAGWETRYPTFEGVHALLHLAAARRARELGNDGRAIDEIEATIEPAWRIRSPYILADALGRRGEILASRPGDRRLAVDQLAAAFAGWPTAMFSDDRDRLKRWLHHLGATVKEIEDAWSKGGSPSAQLRAMPNFDENQALNELRRMLAGK